MQDRPQSVHEQIGHIDQCNARIRSIFLEHPQDGLLLHECLLDLLASITEEAKTMLERELNACYVSPQDIDRIGFALECCLQSSWEQSVRLFLVIPE